ncbi:hypothetical protein ACNUIZ_25430 [Pseudomonas aeruginosa]
MKGATLHRLIDIYADSRRDLRVRLAALRMFVRAVCADRNTSFAEYRQVCRRLLKGMPFTEQALERERAAYLDRTRAARQAMEESGAWLIGNSAMIEQALTFDDLCDLLGVNHAHRAEAAEVCAGDAGIVGGLLWIGGEFEDSADHKSGRSNRGNTGHLPLRSRTCFRSSCLKTRRPSLTRSPRVALSTAPRVRKWRRTELCRFGGRHSPSTAWTDRPVRLSESRRRTR